MKSTSKFNFYLATALWIWLATADATSAPVNSTSSATTPSVTNSSTATTNTASPTTPSTTPAPQCPTPSAPGNASVSCDGPPPYVVNSATCTIGCNAGYVSPTATSVSMSCVPASGGSGAVWNNSAAQLQCVPTVAVVIGGLAVDSSYTTDVQVFSPELPSCHGTVLPSLSVATAGASTGFVGGKAIICGGATETYVNCTQQTGGGQFCLANTQSFSTAGGSLWQTGPKTTACYQLDSTLTHSWKKVGDLLVARAYAASVVLPDGTLFVMGGMGANGILNSTEIVSVDGDTLKVKPGPAAMPMALFGHCAAVVGGKVYVSGGFGTNYTTAVLSYDITHRTWSTNKFAMSDSRIDHGCAAVQVDGMLQLLVAGGGNENGYLNRSEVMDPTNLGWQYIGDFNSGQAAVTSGINVTLPGVALRRSAATYVDFMGRLVQVGGVSCSKSPSGADSCSRLSSAVRFVGGNNGTYTDSFAFVRNATLIQPKSSPSVITMPNTLVCS